MPYDLFGEIPVTETELFLWVKAVAPHYLSPERSFRNYVQSYNVVDKIKTAKLRGTFQDTIDSRREPWHARLALNRLT